MKNELDPTLREENRNMNTISSSFGFFYKYIFCTLWYFVGGISIIFLLIYSNTNPFIYFFLGGWIIMSILFYFTASKLKRITISGNNLHISNYKKEVHVNITDIDSITEHKYWNPEFITIAFKKPNEFGDKIIFMPKIRIFRSKTHPAVEELKKIIGKK
jgi:hypothetical protein